MDKCFLVRIEQSTPESPDWEYVLVIKAENAEKAQERALKTAGKDALILFTQEITTDGFFILGEDGASVRVF